MVLAHLFRTPRLSWPPSGSVSLKGDHLKVKNLIVINLFFGADLQNVSDAFSK